MKNREDFHKASLQTAASSTAESCSGDNVKYYLSFRMNSLSVMHATGQRRALWECWRFDGGLCRDLGPSLFYELAFAGSSYNYNIMHGFVELKIVVV